MNKPRWLFFLTITSHAFLTYSWILFWNYRGVDLSLKRVHWNLPWFKSCQMCVCVCIYICLCDLCVYVICVYVNVHEYVHVFLYMYMYMIVHVYNMCIICTWILQPEQNLRKRISSQISSVGAAESCSSLFSCILSISVQGSLTF